jgi:hypothetical protein
VPAGIGEGEASPFYIESARDHLPPGHGNDESYAVRAKAGRASRGCDGTCPLRSSIGSEFPQCGSGDKVALKIGGIVDGGMHAEEALGWIELI